MGAGMLYSSIQFLGHHSRLVLPAGVVLGLFLPELSARWDLIIPLIITFIYATSLARIDLKHSIISALQPHHLTQNLGISLFILCAVPFGYVGLAKLFGLPELLKPSLVWCAVAPPIASTIWMCMLLGFRASLAMEIVVLSSLAAPFTGPFIASFLLQDIIQIDAVSLFLKLVAMMAGGGMMAVLLKKTVGKAQIEAHADFFNGLSALAMLVFLVSVLNGGWDVLFLQPELSFSLLMLAVIINFGMQSLWVCLGCLRKSGSFRTLSPVISVVSGNRNIGLYFAALPADPVFSLFTAIYQIPIYLTPIFLGTLVSFLGLNGKDDGKN